MEDYYNLIGKQGSFRAIRPGNPVVRGKIIDPRMAAAGIVQVRLEDGYKASCFFPAVEMDK